MKDPGPNVLEQQIETNRLLALLIAAGGAPAPQAGSSPGVSGGGRCQWPALFSWSNGTVHPFNTAGTDGYAVTVTSLEAEFLSHDSAIKITVPAHTGSNATLDIGLPMGPKEAPHLQLAWMSKHWPIGCWISAQFTYGNGSNFLKAGVNLNETGVLTQYLNSAGVWTTVGTMEFDYYPKDWKKIDLAVNFADAEYLGAGVNADWHDLSAQAVQVGAATATKRLTLTITITNNSADTPNEVYLVDVPVTAELYTGPPA